MKKWNIHFCGKLSWDANCREYGADRIHIQTPWGHLGIALTSKSRFVDRAKGEVWVDWSKARTSELLRPGHVGLLIDKLLPEHTSVIDHYLDQREWGMALIETLATLGKREKPQIDLDYYTEIKLLAENPHVAPAIRRGLTHQLKGFSIVAKIRRGARGGRTLPTRG